MILAIAAILVALWLLGVVVLHVANALIHLLLALAVAVAIYHYFTKRRRTYGLFHNRRPDD
jgi:K+-sensing histidine kinase KdpD